MMQASKGKLVVAKTVSSIVEDLLEEVEVLGVGTGSTVKLVLEYLAQSRKALNLLRSKTIIASSYDTLYFLESMGVHASLTLPAREIDLYFDGADEVSITDCSMVKGRGAALLREKILAYNARNVIIAVDETKVSRVLGEKGKAVPVEVLPYALKAVEKVISSWGVKCRVRTCDCKDGPIITDSFGAIIDTWPWQVLNYTEYAKRLRELPGVIEHGLFIGYANLIVIGYNDGSIEVIKCKRSRSRV